MIKLIKDQSPNVTYICKDEKRSETVANSMAEEQPLIPQDFLEAIATERGISDTEFRVLSSVMSGESTVAIAKKLDTSQEVIRNRLREVYRRFQIRGMGPGKLAKLQRHLLSEYQARITAKPNPVSTTMVVRASDPQTPQQDWGEAPDVSIFYGRNEELDTLKGWIVTNRSRLVAILGMGGMGKSTLSKKLAEEIEGEFDYIIWRSLGNAPLLPNLLADLIKVLSHQSETDISEDIEGGISQLIKYLDEYRCLLILDDVETILKSGDRLGRYDEGYEEYGRLLIRVGQTQHQSCLLLISQEILREIAAMQRSSGVIRSLQLTGLKPEDARKILQARDLIGEDQWDDLIERSQRNPLALKIVANTIQDIFNGNVAEFVQHHTWVFSDDMDDMSEILEEQFKNFSDFEQQILRSLADKKNSLLTLKTILPESVAKSEIMKILASLKQRNWIETRTSQEETLYTMPYLVRKYVTKYQNS